MYNGQISKKLGILIDQYHKRFKGDPDDGFSLLYTTLGQKALIARLERALAENKTYNSIEEEWNSDDCDVFYRSDSII